MAQIHIPVLLEEIRALLHLTKGDIAIDGTLDGGGHTHMLLESVYPGGRVLGIEQDAQMVDFIERRKQEEGGIWKSLTVHHGNFRDIADIAKKNHAYPANGILLDLGLSRWHYMQSGRGFSFQDPAEPLSMALEDASETKHAAAEILNYATRDELADIFFHYGEIRASRKLADAIIDRRKKKYFYTVGDLIATTDPIMRAGSRGKNPSTKVFQALRIAVNNELQNLTQGLVGAWGTLAIHGRLAAISYHSLEDRIVKNFFKDCMRIGGSLITKKPIEASREETKKNPSARSAKLRVIEKI